RGRAPRPRRDRRGAPERAHPARRRAAEDPAREAGAPAGGEVRRHGRLHRGLMPQTVEVRFKGTRKGYFTWADEADPLRLNEAVVVEADRGRDVGRVTATGETARRKCGSCSAGCSLGAVGEAEPEPLKAVLRRATPEDLRAHHEVRRSEEETRRKVIERVRAHGLVMKVSDTEWQWD